MSLPLAVAAFDALKDGVGGSLWAYPALFGAVSLDSVLPVAPGEAAVVTGGVLAADGELSIAAVFAASMLGGILGDNVSYALGAVLGRPAERRLFTSDRSRERLDWARRQLRERGGVIILAARFVPGGRTATTFSAGTLEMPWRRFFAVDALAAALWAAYASLLGYFGGSAFTENLWKPLLAATIVGLVVATLAEVARRMTSA
ncbi:MAG TPA: DedA family protein [Solirubrobacterales bacterium]|nr:DedA family protein [Solirubrobacterales bacterium]